MFTQCPECDTAFRVTAEVLKKAAGKVRCGGCGIAFNALEHLSEEMPRSALRVKPSDHVPELSPEVNDDEDQSIPRTISAQQSAALLKTLDELAGSNIKIEDTGVEWRVLDSASGNDEPSVEDEAEAESQLIMDTGSMKFVIENDDEDELSIGDASDIFEAPTATLVDSNLEGDSGASIIDEYLTDSPTPVDQFLTATPSQVESLEVFTDSDPSSESSVMRFDDNTPLPDDFDLNDPAPYIQEQPTPVIERRVAMPELEDLQVDLALGDPDEWEQLLGEVDEPAAEQVEAEPEGVVDDAGAEELVIDEPAIEELADPDEAEPVTDTPPDMDTQFAIQAEAMGIDLSGMHKSIEVDDQATRIDDPDAHEQDEVEGDHDSEEVELELTAISHDRPDDGADRPDPSTLDDVLEDELEDVLDAEEEDDTLVADSSIEELEQIDEADDEPDFAADSDSDEVDPLDAIDEIEFELERDPDIETDDDELSPGEKSEIDDVDSGIDSESDSELEPEPEPDSADELDDEADNELDDVIEQEIEDALEDKPETSIDEDLIAAAFENEAPQQVGKSVEDLALADDEASGEHYVPPQTEEEMTINMMIDQDFMRLAAEGEDIFTSTTVDAHTDFANNPNVETIVMEGEFVRSELDRERLAADAAAGSRRYDDTKFSSKPAGNKAPGIRGGRRDSDPPAYGLIAATVVLGLILVAQVLHQSREALATVPSFNQIAGPVYRMVGIPLTPTWDVTGWRFEVTRSEVTRPDGTQSDITQGGTDAGNELLTIYSRIGNTSESGLPYPLVHVSLTDRFEEIIGSKVLEPREYLAGSPDPRKTVAPGETFNAVISIDSPAEDATGFKLNVCYRLANRQLRCAIEDFK